MPPRPVMRGQPVRPISGTASEDFADPAHPSNRLLARINKRWRVIDYPLRWTPRRKKGSPRKKNSVAMRANDNPSS